MKEKLSKALKSSIGNPAVWLSAAYMLFPADVVPDAVPVAGTIDDIAILCICLFGGAFISALASGDNNK